MAPLAGRNQHLRIVFHPTEGLAAKGLQSAPAGSQGEIGAADDIRGALLRFPRLETQEFQARAYGTAVAVRQLLCGLESDGDTTLSGRAFDGSGNAKVS